MSGPRYPLGVVGIRPRPGATLRRIDEALLENFVAQIGLACERELLTDLHQQNIMIAESERLSRTLLNSISHEFRTPLSAILGSAENLLASTSDRQSPHIHEATAEIHAAALRLDRLVSNLLDMTRLESGPLRPKSDWTDVRDVISGSLRELGTELAGRDVRVVAPGADIPLVKADFGLLQQALTNVLHNAVVHTPPGSGITMTLSVEAAVCQIRVADTGPGIAAETIGRIFEKFYRSPQTHATGTGLGLTIARGFVEANGGTLTARNRPEGGAEFVLSLPVSAHADPV